MIPNNSVLNNILLPPLYKSFYIGKVIDNNDESKTGKLKISIPELTQNDQIWIKPLFKNFTPIPKIGDYVIVIRFGYSIENLFYIHNTFIKLKDFETQIKNIIDQKSVINNNYDNFVWFGLIPNVYISLYDNNKFDYKGIVIKTNDHIIMLKDTNNSGNSFFRIKGNPYLIQVLNNTMVLQTKSPNIVLFGDENKIEVNQEEIQLNSTKVSMSSITITNTETIRNIINEELSKRTTPPSISPGNNSDTYTSPGKPGNNGDISISPGNKQPNNNNNTLLLGSWNTDKLNIELLKNIQFNDITFTGNNYSIVQNSSIDFHSNDLKISQKNKLQIEQNMFIFKSNGDFLQNQNNFTFIGNCFSISTSDLKISQKNTIFTTNQLNINTKIMLVNTEQQNNEYKVIRKSDLVEIVNGYNSIINTLLDTLSSVLSVDKITTFSNVLIQLSELNSKVSQLGSTTTYVR